MRESKQDLAREQYLKRALSIIVRNSQFDGVSACALDILCNIGVLYMQGMFAQVHAYAEHATRTRPNMNDVGRALEERNVSIPQLSGYLDKELDACAESGVTSVICRLNQQARALDGSGLSTGRMADDSSRMFFDDDAETILRKVVQYHVKAAEERAENERQKEQALKAAFQETEVAAFSRVQQSLETERSVAVDKEKQEQRKVRIDASSYAFQDSDADDDSDKDAEGEEDGDFEAPAVDITRITETLSFVNPTQHVAEGVMDKSASTAGKVRPLNDTDAPMLSDSLTTADHQHGPNPEHQQIDQSKETDGNNVRNEDAELLAKHRVHEVERVLLSSSTLPSYIPQHCPPFPSPHTYKRTPVFPKREQDFFRTRMHKAEQSRQAEENLQRLISGLHMDQVKLLSGGNQSVKRQKVSAIENIDEAENAAVDIAASKTVVPGAKRMLQSSSTDDDYQSKHNACKLVQELFPPANFRNVNKRTQLASFINWTAH
ncbi:transcription initiation factor TFIID subunit 8 [Coemansia sp. RSA 1939]|nr:transcription initiation factor TFIID subunit 8 [Coemansia sp. RSA 1939]KAJ2607278.1 transcription initiation factor TFIID subunit 8 [Coemansia sp. RSA 1804]